jgi:ketosteroid isomerase-like protein
MYSPLLQLFAFKSRTSIYGWRVLSLSVIAGGLVFVALPAAGQTGKSLSDADLRKIDDITQTAVNAALARDFATWAALFLDEAVVNPPNEPAVKGRAAIRTWLEKFPPITEFKLNNEKVEGREDLAYVLGNYAMTITPPGAPGPIKDSGKFVTPLVSVTTIARARGDSRKSMLCQAN